MRDTKFVALSFLLILLCMGGCRRADEVAPPPANAIEKPTAELIEKTAFLKERIERLEVAQAKLIERMEEMSSIDATADEQGGGVDLERIEAMIDTSVEQSVAAVGRNQLAQIAQREIESYEEQKRLAAERERKDRRQEREQRRREREVERVATMAGELGLNERQSEELLIAREGLRTTIREMFEFMREQGDFDRETMRDTMSELQHEHRKILAEFMSNEQVEQYVEQYGFSLGDGRGSRR